MVTAEKAVQHFENLYKNGAIYLWGANCETITDKLCDRLFKSFGNGTYTKAYYNSKLRDGRGKIGADCSGSMCPISGFDTTAQGYYDRCIAKGPIGSIPRDRPCLVFKGKSSKRINHIGFYCGNGNVIEMKSSRDNCVKRPLAAGKWDYYGIPDWIDYGAEDQKEALPVLKKGSCGKHVKAWQTLLCMCGFYHGEIDSIFGSQTEQALKEWQKANGLKVDGIVGPACWSKINVG